MGTFQGFFTHNRPQVSVPSEFFSELLVEIDHLGELKTTLYLLWRMEQLEGPVRFARKSDLLADRLFMQSLAKSLWEAQQVLEESLERAMLRGSLLSAEAGDETWYFINSPRGQAAFQALAEGRWHPDQAAQSPIALGQSRPNIFQLYEANIGPLTPLLAETLQDAEADYPEHWIEEAFRIAVEKNARSWRYVEAILRSWKEKGKNDREDRGDTEETRRKYYEELARRLGQ
jgi:DnaD/phage-associated family protein